LLLSKRIVYIMNNDVFKIIEVVGTSPDSMEDAIQAAINRAARSEHQLKWFEVVHTRGTIENGAPAKYQVTVKIGVKLQDND